MSDPDLSPLDLGNGLVVLFDEPTPGIYRVRMPSGEVQAFASAGEATRANAAADIAAAIANPPPAPVDQAAIYLAALAEGYLDVATGIHLKTTEYAQAKFTSQATLLHLALGAGVLAPTSPVSFWDAANTERSLPVSDFLALLLRYGARCEQLFADYAP